MQRYVRGSHPLVLTGVAADWPRVEALVAAGL